MSNFLPRTRLLFADKSGLATIEFALASTVLIIGLLNGLEVALWSLDKMETANAVHTAALAVWNACDTKHLPAKTNCTTALNSAISTGLKQTSLGTNVTLSSGYPTEGYYCVNSSGALTNVANYNSSSVPTDCYTYNSSYKNTGAPGDYVVIRATYTYTPLSTGLTVGSVLPTTLTYTGSIRLK